MCGCGFHNRWEGGRETQRGFTLSMPTLIRLISFIVILAGLIYGSMYALATFVHPNKGEMSVRIPAEKLNPRAQ